MHERRTKWTLPALCFHIDELIKDRRKVIAAFGDKNMERVKEKE